MLIRTAILRRRENQPEVLIVKPEDLVVDNQDEARLTILMNHAMDDIRKRHGEDVEYLKDIPKKELVVVCSDFTRVR